MKRIAAYFGLIIVYGLTRFIVCVLPARVDGNRRSIILVIGTFYNVGWFVSHISPLSEAGFRKIIVIADEPVVPMKNVEYLCAPIWMQRFFTRAGAKFLIALRAAIRFRPGYVMGYHLFPGALSALLVARVAGGRAIYQVTGGSAEWIGGGWQMENPVLAALGRPSLLIERLSSGVIRRFDIAILRGKSAVRDISALGFNGTTEIITGSAAIPDYTEYSDRDVDVVFVGRLVDVKRVDRFIEVIDRLGRLRNLNVVVVGSGPQEEFLRREISQRNLDYVKLVGQLDSTSAMLQRSKILLLTSRSEGLSIAMLEAMGAGVVPVVSNVGDLRDAIDHGVNGFLVEQDDLPAFVRLANRVLDHPDEWHCMSTEARKFVLERASVSAITKKWCSIFDAVTT